MSRWPDWVKEATEPTEDEVAAMNPRLEDATLHALRIATEPTDAEVARLVARAMAPAARPIPWGRGAALIGGAAAVALLAWPLRFGPLDLEPGVVAHIDDVVSVGLATTIGGSGDAEVLQADRRGTVVEVHSGSLVFEVDPDSRYRTVRVISDDIEVHVRGTRFTVTDAPAVSVERGHVEVFRQGELIAELSAGEGWSEPVLPRPPPVAVRAPRIEPPGWKPRSPVHQPVPMVMALSVARPAPIEVRTKPVVERPSAAMAFAKMLSRADGGRDAAMLAADWSIFLGSYPDAPEAFRSEARVYRLQARLDSLRPEAAVKAIQDFLIAEPEHSRRLELEYARATLLRGDLADCARAVPAYEIATEAGGEMGARSEVFLALCQLHLGNADAASEAIERARVLGIPEDVSRYATRVLRKVDRPR